MKVIDHQISHLLFLYSCSSATAKSFHIEDITSTVWTEGSKYSLQCWKHYTKCETGLINTEYIMVFFWSSNKFFWFFFFILIVSSCYKSSQPSVSTISSGLIKLLVMKDGIHEPSAVAQEKQKPQIYFWKVDTLCTWPSGYQVEDVLFCTWP